MRGAVTCRSTLPPAGTYLMAFSSRLVSSCASSCRWPLTFAGPAACDAQRQAALARLERVELAEFERHLRQVDAFGRHAAAAGLGLRDLQQRGQGTLHALEIVERRLHGHAGRTVDGLALQRGLQPRRACDTAARAGRGRRC